MAVYFDGATDGKCPVRELADGDDKVQASFTIDTPEDIANLPGLDKIRGGSTALVISTKQVYMLGINGWVVL